MSLKQLQTKLINLRNFSRLKRENLRSTRFSKMAATKRTATLLAENVTPFDGLGENNSEFKKYLDSFADSKILLLGDASHGTSEFYSIRAEISKYMIQNHGFNIIGIEGDWPDAEVVDRYTRRRPSLAASINNGQKEPEEDIQPAFFRFPTWMWRNVEVEEFVEWLRSYNKGKKVHDGVGFYGLDLYSLRTSMMAVIDYLDQVDKKMADVARDRYEQLMMWAEEPQEYGLETHMTGFGGYEKHVTSMLRDLLKKRIQYSSMYSDGDEFHGGEQNARVVAGKQSLLGCTPHIQTS